MKKIPFILVILLTAALASAAQTTRVYVSADGDDVNQCTMTAQCKTVTKALSVVDSGGEVVITKSGDYDRFLISKSVTVAAETGVDAAIVATAGSAISIAGVQSGDSITIRNLHLVGAGTPQTADGMINSFAGSLYVDSCIFTGLNNALTMSNVAGQLFVHNSTFRNNLFGVGIIGPSGEGVMRATIDSCNFEQNDTGISQNGKVFTNIRNSIFSANSSRGLNVRSSILRYQSEALVDNCQFNNNTVGILASATNGGFGVVKLNRSTVANNLTAGIAIGAGGTVYSLGNNVVSGNFPDVSGGSLTVLSPK